MSGVLERTLASIEGADGDASAAARIALDSKTKPRGSLGALEDVACRVAGIRRSAEAGPLHPVVIVAAADHGVAAERVSAYPQEVTRQMLRNFEEGGAAVCVLARAAGASLRIVDAGVGNPTANIASGPAMSRADALHWVERGIGLAGGLATEGFDLVALGEMGIANSTSAAALTSALLTVDPVATCGPGTGLDDAGVDHKIEVVRRALAANDVDAGDPLGILAALGGFEIAFLCGLALGAAAQRMVVVLDGFITGAAALAVARLSGDAVDVMIASHLSPEPGHRLVLDALGLDPLLDLQLRLGEGSGAALALPIVAAALAILSEMATFEAAGVTDSGR